MQTVPSKATDLVSASRIKLYHRCGEAWRLRYVERVPDPGGAAAEVGKAIHAAIELRAEQAPGTTATREHIEACLAELAGRGDVAVEHIERCREIIADLEPLRLGPVVEGFGPEHRFELALADDVRAQGYIDLIRLDGDEVELVDWKSGQAKLDAAEYDAQVGLYLVWAREQWPDRAIKFTLEYLALGERVVVRWSPELDAWHRRAIVAAVRSMRRGYTPARPGDACGWCSYSARCEAFAKKVAEADRFGVDPLESLSLDAALAERVELKERVKLITKRLADVDSSLKRRIEANDGRALRGDGLTARFVRRKTRTLDPGDLPVVAERAGVELVDLLRATRPSVSKLSEILKTDEQRAALDERVRVGSTSYLDVRSKK